MVFAILVILWTFVFTEQPVELLYPLCAIVIRAGYMQRAIVIFRFWPVFLAVLFFVAPLLLPAANLLRGHQSVFPEGLIRDSLLKAGRMYVSVLLMLNLRDDPSVAGVGLFFLRPLASMGILAQMIFRYPDDLLRRIYDISYATKLRLQHARGGLVSKLKLIRGAATAITVELLTVANQLSVVTTARGRIPPMALWKRPPRGMGPVLVADIMLAVFIGIFTILLRRITAAGLLDMKLFDLDSYN